MKTRIIFPVCALLIFFSAHAYVSKSGHIKTKAYARDAAERILDSAEVDDAGNYRFENLKTGTYDFVFVRNGYENVTIKSVEHHPGLSGYHIMLDFAAWKKKPKPSDLIIPDTASLVHDEAALEKSPDRKTAIIVETSDARVSGEGLLGAGVRGTGESKKAEKAAYGRPVEVRSPEPGYISREDIEYDAVKAPTPAKDMAMAIRKTSARGSGISSSEVVANSSVKSGQLTAGYWRDLDNWEKWKETNKSADIFQYQDKWGFYTDYRFSATFKDAEGKALVGTHVKLYDNHNTLHWEAVTDNNGNAEFFADLGKRYLKKDLRTFKVKIASGERVIEFKINPYTASKEIYNLPVKSSAQPIADIAFVVDATGSMGDEIQYLQAELLDVITRVKKTNKCIDLRMASVFYRDNTDEYLTREADFSSNPADIVNFIYNQGAGGGGDFPEAVDAAMEASLEKLSWSENALSKIIFLVLDAPPHDDSVSAEKVRKYTKLAAEKGIKIIPITASGIDQSTEFLMKYMAIATNGSYIYITDHSGIGGTHAKPTGVKENVQYLNDLMVDIITQNTVWSGCKDSTQSPVQGVVEIVSSGQWQVQFYPNPATDYIMIKSSVVPDEIGVYDLTGNLVKKIDQVAGEKTKIDIKELLTGVYIVRCRKGEQSLSCRMLVMH